MTNVHPIRPFQSAAKFKDRRNVYAAVVRDIVREQREGRSGFAPIRRVRQALQTEPRPAA